MRQQLRTYCARYLAELLQFLRRLLGFSTVRVFFLDLLEEEPGVARILELSEGIALLQHSRRDFWILAMFLHDFIERHNSCLVLLLSVQGFTDHILGTAGLWRLRSLLQILLKIYHSSLVVLLLVILQGALVQLVSDIRFCRGECRW